MSTSRSGFPQAAAQASGYIAWFKTPLPGRREPLAAVWCRGFTLVESAIVLVIAGIVLGGVLQGRALIDTARGRALNNEVQAITAAWLAFDQRYQALPGDFALAGSHLHPEAVSGNGNGRVDTALERAGVWQHLSLAGLIKGRFDGRVATSGGATDAGCSAATCPTNPFKGFYNLSFGRQGAGSSFAANELSTGAGVPVAILSRLDRALDDGIANRGRVRVHRAYVDICLQDDAWAAGDEALLCAAVIRP